MQMVQMVVSSQRSLVCLQIGPNMETSDRASGPLPIAPSFRLLLHSPRLSSDLNHFIRAERPPSFLRLLPRVWSTLRITVSRTVVTSQAALPGLVVHL